MIDHPWIRAELDAVLAPYAGKLSLDDVQWMRERLCELLCTDEHALELLREALPEHFEESGEIFWEVESAPANDAKVG